MICTSGFQEPREFYTGLLGLEATFEAHRYVSLRRPGPLPYELARLAHDRPTLPEACRGVRAPGSLRNVEVDDVDAAWARSVVRGGLRAELELRGEEFGQRHFLVADLNGVLVDVITPVEPSAAFAATFVGGVKGPGGGRGVRRLWSIDLGRADVLGSRLTA